MAAKKREFLKLVRPLLEDLFPEADGGELTEGKDWKGYKIDFVAERREESKRYRSVVKCIPKCSVTPIEIKHINMAARRMSGRYVKIERKYLALPDDSDVQDLDGFQLIRVPGFACVGEE